MYDDEWILENWKIHKNWLKLCNAYNLEHNTNIKYNTFKSHCNRELILGFKYSDEQKAWLCENYPKLGRVKTAEKFNEVFSENKTPHAIKVICQKMGLRVTFERRQARAIENTGKLVHDIGTIVPKSHGELYKKTIDGWVRLKNINYGKPIPKDKAIIHLDNNVLNCEKDNLVAVDRTILARMTANKFWSSDKEITQTGLLCCELEAVLNSSCNFI